MRSPRGDDSTRDEQAEPTGGLLKEEIPDDLLKEEITAGLTSEPRPEGLSIQAGEKGATPPKAPMGRPKDWP
jgi:hypothetical protein